MKISKINLLICNRISLIFSPVDPVRRWNQLCSLLSILCQLCVGQINDKVRHEDGIPFARITVQSLNRFQMFSKYPMSK